VHFLKRENQLLKADKKEEVVMKKDVFIVSATRTPIGDFGGAIKDVSATELAILVINLPLNGPGLKRKKWRLYLWVTASTLLQITSRVSLL
jgi:hypothetical protein